MWEIKKKETPHNKLTHRSWYVLIWKGKYTDHPQMKKQTYKTSELSKKVK